MDVTGLESAFKAIGYQPRRVARHQEDKYRLVRRDAHRRMMEDAYLDRMARARMKRDTVAFKQAKTDLAAWNRLNPDDQIEFQPAQIRSRLRELKATSGERFLKSLSPELRKEAADALRTGG